MVNSISLAGFSILLAQVGQWNLLVIAGLVGLALLLRGVSMWRRRLGQGAYQPRKLFAALCRAHELDQAQQRLLALIAKSHHLPQPALIFVRPDLLSSEKLSTQFAAHRAQVETVRDRIFRGAAGSL